MSPHRIVGWADRNPWITSLIMVVLVAGAGFISFTHQQRDTEALLHRVQHLAQCNRAYVAAAAESIVLFRAAQARVAAADDRIWRDVQIVFTQNAGPDDYDRLRLAVAHRNMLRNNQIRQLAEHPLPPPPATFCEEGG